MTTILTNPAEAVSRSTRTRVSILRRAPQLLMRAMIFFLIGAILSVLIAWALGLWADVDSATVITNSIPQRGRMWNISAWNSSGALRLHCQQQVYSYSGYRATGAPDSPMSGDSGLAWCPATADGQVEWLVLDYSKQIEPKEVQIYENYSPGGVTRVTLFNDAGEEIEAWRGQDPTPITYSSGISRIPLKVSIKTQRVKIYIDSPKVPGWQEIDAVGLLDDTGNIQWASDVQESSSYANLNATSPPATMADLLPSWCPLAQPDSELPSKREAGTATNERDFEARGWPMLALWTERASVNPNAPNVTRPAGSAGRAPWVRAVARPGLAPILPSRPIWSGLLFDSIFFAIVLSALCWLLVKPRRLLVELRRMRHGCCIACGYELDFDFRSGCPECGWRRSPM